MRLHCIWRLFTFESRLQLRVYYFPISVLNSYNTTENIWKSSFDRFQFKMLAFKSFHSIEKKRVSTGCRSLKWTPCVQWCCQGSWIEGESRNGIEKVTNFLQENRVWIWRGSIIYTRYVCLNSRAVKPKNNWHLPRFKRTKKTWNKLSWKEINS